MFTIFARLPHGVDRQRAEARLAVVAAQLRGLDERAWADSTGATRRVTVMRETEARLAQSPGGGIEIVTGAIAAVLIIIAIACVNLSTMLLARGAARAKEMSIRLAIGASYRRILRQLATESLMIAAFGAAIALASVWAGVRLFNAYRPAIIPAFDVALDWRVFTFGIGIAVAAALTFGLLPAAHTLRLAVTEGLKGRLVAARASWMRLGAREALIVTQVAVSIAMLLVSTLFVRAMSAGATLPTGFNGAGVTVVTAHLDAVPETNREAVIVNAVRAAETMPGVEHVALATIVPLSGSSTQVAVTIDDQERVFLANVVSPGYFEMLRIPLRSGRDFTDRDQSGAPLVAIVNETFARTMFETTNVVGRLVGSDGTQMEIIGVVADTRYRSLSGPFQPIVYRPIAQVPVWRFILHARTRGGGPTIAALDAAVRAVDRRMAVDQAMSVRAFMERAMAPERAAQWLGAAVGAMQLMLAAMALWGLVAYAVERRATELGVRLALGGTPSSLVRLTMRPAAVSIAIGVAAGSVLGAVVAKVVQSQSVGLAPLNLLIVLPVAALFTLVAMPSAWWPARRAALADPATSLRRE
jgi:predicted permease